MRTAFCLDPLPIKAEPFDHITCENFVFSDVYAELDRSFPECPPRDSGPTGYSYYWGDPEYDALVATNPAWKCLFETVHSQAFVDYFVRQFEATYAEQGCTIDLSKAVYTPYCETREGKEMRYLSPVTLAPHELFVRLDIHQGRMGYQRKIHLDHRRRLATLLIYFTDAAESGFEGGELILHGQSFGILRPEVVRLSPKSNLMAGFACSPKSFHSVPAIHAQSKPRNFVQVQLSSQVDAWVK